MVLSSKGIDAEAALGGGEADLTSFSKVGPDEAACFHRFRVATGDPRLWLGEHDQQWLGLTLEIESRDEEPARDVGESWCRTVVPSVIDMCERARTARTQVSPKPRRKPCVDQ